MVINMSFTNTIIYSDTLNETEFLRTLAKLGVKTLGVRVMDSYDLSLFILSKLGKTKKGVYLNNEDTGQIIGFDGGWE